MNTRRCVHCMESIEENLAYCNHCYERQKENLPHELNVGSLLQRRYWIGAAFGGDFWSIQYHALDNIRCKRVTIREFYPLYFAMRNHKMGSNVLAMDKDYDRHFKDFYNQAVMWQKSGQIPGVEQILDVFEQNDTLYLVLEPVEGKAIASQITSAFPPYFGADFQYIWGPLMDTLHMLHKRGLVHGDICPENIVQTGHIRPVGLDCEIREPPLVLVNPGNPACHHGDVMGPSTAAHPQLPYAAPEIHSGRVGPYTDVYGLCATLYHLLTGIVPPCAMNRLNQWEEPDWTALNHAHIQLDDRKKEAIKRGMALKPGDRFQSIMELKEILYAPNEIPPVMITPGCTNPEVPGAAELIIPIGSDIPGSEVYYHPVQEELPETMPVGSAAHGVSTGYQPPAYPPQSGGAEEIGHTIPLEGLPGHKAAERICYTAPIDRDALYTAPVQVQEPAIRTSAELVQQTNLQPPVETVQQPEVVDQPAAPAAPQQKKKTDRGSIIPIFLGAVVVFLLMLLFPGGKIPETAPSGMTAAVPEGPVTARSATVPVKEGALIFVYETEDFSFWVNENLELTAIIRNLPLRQQYTVNLPQTPNKEHEFSWTLYAYSPTRTMRFVTYYAKNDIKPAKQVISLEDMTTSLYMTRENDPETYDYVHDIPLQMSRTANAIIWTCKLPEASLPIDPAGFTGFKVQTYDCGNPEKIIRRYETD